MTIPMFVDEDAHYEYERERYESELPTYEELWERIDREYDDGYTDSDYDY